MNKTSFIIEIINNLKNNILSHMKTIYIINFYNKIQCYNNFSEENKIHYV